MRKKRLPFQEAPNEGVRHTLTTGAVELGDVPSPGVPAIVTAGTATDDELAAWVGPDLALRLGADFAGQDATAEAFDAWYAGVASPLGIERDQAFDLFTGHTTAEEFAAELPEEDLDGFLERFPQLQAAHQARLDARAGTANAGSGTSETDGTGGSAA